MSAFTPTAHALLNQYRQNRSTGNLTDAQMRKMLKSVLSKGRPHLHMKLHRSMTNLNMMAGDQRRYLGREDVVVPLLQNITRLRREYYATLLARVKRRRFGLARKKKENSEDFESSPEEDTILFGGKIPWKYAIKLDKQYYDARALWKYICQSSYAVVPHSKRMFTLTELMRLAYLMDKAEYNAYNVCPLFTTAVDLARAREPVPSAYNSLSNASTVENSNVPRTPPARRRRLSPPNAPRRRRQRRGNS